MSCSTPGPSDGSSVSSCELDRIGQRVVPRRRALTLSASLVGGMALSRWAGAAAPAVQTDPPGPPIKPGGPPLPVAQIEETVGAEGHVSNSVLDIPIARTDIGDVQGPRSVTFSPSFEIHGDLYFQPLADGNALLNGDMALLPEETNPFISALLRNQLVFQAFHQHLIEMNPQVWFIHFRCVAAPLVLAQRIRAALEVTQTPLPQTSPKNPTTPLDAHQLASILHGEAEVEDEGVVSVSVDRLESVRLGGAIALPQTGISHVIEFKPLGGSRAAVVADFSMTDAEVVPVVSLMLNELDWFQGCLYNQETDEYPQLYFDHMLKTGDAYQLAREIRRGLDLTKSK